MSKRTLTNGSLTLDIVSLSAYIDGVDLLLQPKEFALLRLLAENEDKYISAEDIYRNIWRRPLNEDKGAVHAAVYRLRKKIETTGFDITMSRGKGYKLEKK